MKIKAVYLWEKPIRPNHRQRNIERSYDFSWKSLADFQANGGNNIVTDGSYTIDSDGVKQTSGSNDRNICVSAAFPAEYVNAKKIEVYFTGYYMYASWSNWKQLRISPNWDITPSNCLGFHVAFASNSGYQATTLYINNWELYNVQQARTTWLTNFQLIVDFENKTAQTILTGANTRDRTTTLTDAQLATIKTFGYIAPVRWRGYSSYNGEYLKSLWYKIYF